MGGQDQRGIYPTFQLGIHDHLDDDRGGILNAYSRDGAFRKPYRTGALAIQCANNAERTTAIPGYSLLKETRINAAQPGRYRIFWRMKNADGATTVNARFRVNGVNVSVVQSTASAVYVNKTHNYDVDLAAGDLLQIWGDPVTDEIFIDQFRIYYDWGLYQFGDGGRANLVTLLPLSSVDLLDFTNQDP